MHWAIAIWMLLLPASGETVVSDAKDREVAYSIGYQIGGDFKRQDLKIDPELVVQGALDAISGSRPRIPMREMEQALAWLQRETRATLERERNEQAPEELPAEPGNR